MLPRTIAAASASIMVSGVIGSRARTRYTRRHEYTHTSVEFVRETPAPVSRIGPCRQWGAQRAQHRVDAALA
jgi:hypothetical protein